MNYFNTPTQYDKAYLGVENNRSMCSIFGLFTASQFLEDGDVSPEKYLNNLDLSVGNYLFYGIQGHLSFFELLEFTTNYPESKVEATSAMMIKENVLGYDKIFKDEKTNDKNYAIIFLKNSKFFTVLVRKVGDKLFTYHFRDCHDSVQYDFQTQKQLTEFLNDRHEFDKQIFVDGYPIGEFSNIEFLIVDQKVQSKLRTDIVTPKKEHNIYDDVDPELLEAIKLSESLQTEQEYFEKLQMEAFAEEA